MEIASLRIESLSIMCFVFDGGRRMKFICQCETPCADMAEHLAKEEEE